MASPTNGHALGTSDRPVGVTQQRPKTQRKSPIRWTLGLLVRLCIWYLLLTPFLRCPSRVSDLTESSPRVCRPYLVVRSYVEPHIAPYYDTYGAPYVDSARPYVRVLNEKVFMPASNVAKRGYEKYGAPALDRAQAYGQQQWDANVVPHIRTAKDKANTWYNAQVAPPVERFKTAISPYYQKVHNAYWGALDGYILPFCARYRPFIGKTYSSGQEILTTTFMPYAQSTWSSTIYLVNSSLWPRIANLYSANVEPQLVKIGQRLASYREGNRLRKVMDEVETNSSAEYSATAPSASTEASKAESSIVSSVVETTPTPSLSPSELAALAREKIASDLKTWKERFATASEEGVEDLEGRVVEIVASYLSSGVDSDGEGLVTALESAVQHQTTAIKRSINTLTEALPFEDAPEEEERAADDLLTEVRNAAMSIRDRAHALREWHVSFNQELTRRVSIAVNATLAVLDDVRDLGLQEVGMRWAWMDGVTYKDWENYHALKAEFEDWKEKFREIGLQHARVEGAKELSDDILFRGMEIAEAAAKELVRLKDVGKWKIAAREVSEDFDTRSEPPPPLPKPTHVAGENATSLADEDSQAPSHSEQTVPEVSGNINHHSPNDVSTSEPTDSFEDFAADTVVDSEAAGFGHETNKGTWGAAAAEVRADEHGVDSDFAAKRKDYSMDDDEVVDEQSPQSNARRGTESGQKEQHQTSDVPSASGQKPAHHEALKNLLSELLAGKDASLTENILKKLHAIYETPQPSHASSSISNEPASSTPSTSETHTATVDMVLEKVEEPTQSSDDSAKLQDDRTVDYDAVEEESAFTTSAATNTVAASSVPDATGFSEQATDSETETVASPEDTEDSASSVTETRSTQTEPSNDANEVADL